jgi:hypothetical protein
VPVPPSGSAADSSGEPFLARLRAGVAARPLRLLAACLVTSVAPALAVGHDPRPSVAGAARAAAAARGGLPVPAPGDSASWALLARSAAARCPGLPYQVLVAIADVETGLGQRAGPSAAGAAGPMQFLPATWEAYGVDGDGDGRVDVMSPADSLHAASQMLCANGGGELRLLPSALWNYNHSYAYVSQVLDMAGLQS